MTDSHGSCGATENKPGRSVVRVGSVKAERMLECH